MNYRKLSGFLSAVHHFVMCRELRIINVICDSGNLSLRRALRVLILLHFLGRRNSSAVNMKSLEHSPSMGCKTPPAVPRKSMSDNEFENKLNHSRRSTDPISLMNHSSSDLQAATGNFSSNRQLGQGTTGCVFRAKYADGRVGSYCLLSKIFPNKLVYRLNSGNHLSKN